MKLWASITKTAVLLALVALLVLAVSRPNHEDDDLYNQFVTIRGAVTVTEPQTQKTSIPVGTALIFQRTDCKRCLAVAVTDEKGEYKLRVGKGKYRLVVRNCGLVNQSLDCLAPSQPRIVDANNTILDNVFNVKLIRPATPLDVTLPSLTKSPSGQK
ncbi:MAG: hypothetical protein JNK38_17155 [Acidobacteria bacterium]|nr:hypothetical protein [Acidobacteriota bacterium]